MGILVAVGDSGVVWILNNLNHSFDPRYQYLSLASLDQAPIQRLEITKMD